MSGTTTNLTATVQEYFADLRRVRASGGATQERSLYGPLGNLLTAIGATLRPKVFCVQELADPGRHRYTVTAFRVGRMCSWPILQAPDTAEEPQNESPFILQMTQTHPHLAQLS